MSSELLLDSSSPVIFTNKPTLSFKINNKLLSSLSSSNAKHYIPISENELIITNLTSNYIAYRARITRKKYYSVEPSHLVISPNSKINVKITFYFNPKEKFPPEGHKFRFEGVVIPNNMKYQDAKEIYEEFIANKKEVKGNSIKKVVEFIFDDNYNYVPSSEDNNNIKLDSSQTLTMSISSVNSDFNPKASVYSNALGKSVERPSRISLRNKKSRELLKSKKQEKETLDPVKLKEECDKLQSENDNNLKELNDIKQKINNITAKNKFRYNVPDVNFSSINTKTVSLLFGMAFFLGFYLTK